MHITQDISIALILHLIKLSLHLSRRILDLRFLLTIALLKSR